MRLECPPGMNYDDYQCWEYEELSKLKRAIKCNLTLSLFDLELISNIIHMHGTSTYNNTYAKEEQAWFKSLVIEIDKTIKEHDGDPF